MQQRLRLHDPADPRAERSTLSAISDRVRSAGPGHIFPGVSSETKCPLSMVALAVSDTICLIDVSRNSLKHVCSCQEISVLSCVMRYSVMQSGCCIGEVNIGSVTLLKQMGTSSHPKCNRFNMHVGVF